MSDRIDPGLVRTIGLVPLDPDIALLSCCARTELSALCREQIQELAEQISDWPRLVRLAGMHGVRTLLYRSLAEVCPDVVPEALMVRLQQAFRQAAMVNLSFGKQLDEILQLLEVPGIPAIGFKGPLLAAAAYRNLALRPCTDLDILIPRQRYEQVEKTLVASGYRIPGRKGNLKGVKKAAHLYLSRQNAFVRPRSASLDVHTGMFPPGYNYTPGFDELTRRATTVSIGGMPFSSLAPEDLLLVLCFHGVKNRWEVLKHYCDVAELIRSHPELDWDAAISRARDTRAERILRLGVYMTHHLLDAPVPPSVSAWMAQDARVKPLTAELLESLQHSHVQRLDPRARFWFHLSVQDTLSTKARYCLYALARRVNADWAADEP